MSTDASTDKSLDALVKAVTRASLPSLSGTLAEKYQIDRELGRGGMGAVFLARHLTTRRLVAIKTIVVRSSDPEKPDLMAKRFAREAQIIGQIRCEHVVEVHDAGLSSDMGADCPVPYMVMEYLQGEDFASIAKRCGPLPPSTVVKIGIQALRGLEAAHALGVVHRDIKPANLFAATQGERPILKVVDFGVARVASGAEVDLTMQDLTQTGALVGSPVYMSPEQIRGSRDVDARSDLWSLAVSLYKLLSGRTPHIRADGIGGLMVTISTVAAEPVDRYAPWVPPRLTALLQRALSLSLSERFESAADMRRALESLALVDSYEFSTDEFRPLTDDERGGVVAYRESVVSFDEVPALPRASLPLRAKARRSPLATIGVVVAAVAAGLALGFSRLVAGAPTHAPEIVTVNAIPPSRVAAANPTAVPATDATLPAAMPATPAAASDARKPPSTKPVAKPSASVAAAPRKAPAPGSAAPPVATYQKDWDGPPAH